MRTTVTLEPDLAARLRQLSHERNISFKEAINSTLRAGLSAETRTPAPYQEQTRALGLLPGVDLSKALQLAAALEDEETLRELEARR